MKKLKQQTSRFFKETPSTDERAAGGGGNFDAGIQAPALKKKTSLWGLKKARKQEVAASAPPVPAIPAQYRFSASGADERPMTAIRDGGQGEKEVKKKESFLKLRAKGSRFFRTTSSSSTPPDPSLGATEDDTVPAIAPHRSALARTRTTLGTTSSSTSVPSRISISKPIPLAHPIAYSPVPAGLATVPFVRPPGPPPPRPARPESLDKEIVGFMRCMGTRFVLPSSASTSISSGQSTRQSEASMGSIEARLRLPSGHARPATLGSQHTSLPPKYGNISDGSFISRPRGLSSLSNTLNDTGLGRGRLSRLANGNVIFVRDSAESERPIEQWVPEMEGRFTLERRVEGKKGKSNGMMLKEVGGGWLFIPDI